MRDEPQVRSSLLARIHRLTIDRLRAEIQPVSIHDFYRFLFAWQRVDQEHRTEGLEGLQSVLEQLDGCELPLAAWESAVLPARVADYDPEWLDRLCFSGRVGWGRLSTPQNSNSRASAPLRTSWIALSFGYASLFVTRRRSGRVRRPKLR